MGITTHEYPLYRAYIGISHTLGSGAHIPAYPLKTPSKSASPAAEGAADKALRKSDGCVVEIMGGISITHTIHGAGIFTDMNG